MVLNVFAFIVLCLLVGLAVFALIKLATWPKRAALARNNPYVDSINVLSWGGLVLTAGLGWLAALTWAYAPARDANEEA